jgi:hypothetical protein
MTALPRRSLSARRFCGARLTWRSSVALTSVRSRLCRKVSRSGVCVCVGCDEGTSNDSRYPCGAEWPADLQALNRLKIDAKRKPRSSLCVLKDCRNGTCSGCPFDAVLIKRKFQNLLSTNSLKIRSIRPVTGEFSWVQYPCKARFCPKRGLCSQERIKELRLPRR